jgi:hypothetical protein
MAVFDLHDEEQFQHFMQLFLHAHPSYHAWHEGVRADLGGYFLPPAIAEVLVRWGLAQQLITRDQGDWLIALVRDHSARPEEVVAILPGAFPDNPPWDQAGVRAGDLFRWIYMFKEMDAAEGKVLTVPTAIRACEATRDTPAELAWTRTRAATLAAWLADQRRAAVGAALLAILTPPPPWAEDQER